MAAGAMEDTNLDLYADTEDINRMGIKVEGSSPDELRNDPETDALFDCVITSRLDVVETKVDMMDSSSKVGEECVVSEGPGSIDNLLALPPQKFHVYVGNLTWYTTDECIENLLKEIGVDDLVDLKIFDNRLNGQSKGYCNVCVGSERSLRLIHEKLAKREVNGVRIMVAAPSKAAAAQFEAQSECKPRPPPTNSCTGGCNPRGPMSAGAPPPPPQPYGLPPGGPRMVGVSRGNRVPGPISGVSSPTNTRMSICPPHQHPPPPVPPHHMNYGPHRPPLSPFHPHNQRPFRPYHPSGPGHAPCLFPPTSPIDHHHRGPPPLRGDWMRMPGPHCTPISQQIPHRPPGPMAHQPPAQEIIGSPGPGIALNEPPPAPHANPAFFQPQYSSPVPASSPEPQTSKIIKERNHQHQLQHNTYDSPARLTNDSKHRHIRYHGLSETEIDEIVSRNRTVSTSAISRAVSDAAKGDFASAIETLVTAVSLIKQSRVGSDDRCKILVTSLQDTLHGIETKSYGRIKVVHVKRSKSRSRSRERANLRVHRTRHYRSRSRSHGRSRSRERYYNRRRSRSCSSSRGQDYERSSKYDDRERYRDHTHERDRYKREHEREREHSVKSSRSSTARTHERDRNDEHREHEHVEQRSSSRR